jgi:hypothetical protein
LTAKYLFVAQVEDEEIQDVDLLISASNAAHYKFKSVDLPMKKFKEHSFTILDTTEGQVFLQVNHQGEKSKYGNIYISDASGTRYSLSIKNNVRSPEGQCDFERIQSLEGIYLVNVYDEDKLELLKTSDKASIPFEKGGKKSKSSSRQDNIVADIDNYKRTHISFDKGGIWKTLSAPLVDSNGRKINCNDDECSLHLHSITSSRFGPFYSTENAVGLIIGTGNVGYHLANRADEVNTYLSRDGGLTWYEVS